MGPHLAADELSLWFHAPNYSGRLVLQEAWWHTTDEPKEIKGDSDGLNFDQELIQKAFLNSF